MPDESVYTGGCLCGAIRFEVKGTALRPHTCSCTICQRHTGAPTSAWVEFAKEAVTWTGPGGAPATYRSSDFSSRVFCPTCGSSLGAIDDAPVVALLLGAFDEAASAEFAPASHSYPDCQPAWWTVETRSD